MNKKNLLTDLYRLLKENLVPTYLDQKDKTPKSIGIIGQKYNLCYNACIDFIFKIIRSRSKLNRSVISQINYPLSELELKLSRSEHEAEEVLGKFFSIIFFENEIKLAEALNCGEIDYCVIPSKVYLGKTAEVIELGNYAGLVLDSEVLLSAATTRESGDLYLCYRCKPIDISTVYVTHLNSVLSKELISQNNRKIVTLKHTHNCFENFSQDDSNSAFVCNEHFLNSVRTQGGSLTTSKLDVGENSIEFRLLKHKNYKLKDDNAYPPSLHRRLKQFLFWAWKKQVLEAIVNIVFAAVLYVTFHSLAIKDVVGDSDVIKSLCDYFPENQETVISVVFSLVSYMLFKTLHQTTRLKMQLKKAKGYWLLYTRRVDHSAKSQNDRESVSDVHLYELPRIVRIDYSGYGSRSLSFQIERLNKAGKYLQSKHFLFAPYDRKKARIILTYSNSDIPESIARHGFIHGIAELDCSIVYESSNVYEMNGNFYSKNRDEHGTLKYYRLADEEDFMMLRHSTFLSKN